MDVNNHGRAASNEDATIQAAYRAALEIARELDPAIVLQRVADAARQVIGAKYAALGVADESGRVHTFVTSGISRLDRLAIGDIPEGHGLIGELIRQRQPLLVPDIAEDPRSVGFPPNHPPMRSLLGVPIMLGNRVLGNLYLTEPLHRSTFSTSDMSAITILATHAAPAIDRAQLFAHATRSQHQAEEQRDHLQVILNSIDAAVFIENSPRGAIEVVNNAARSLLADRSRRFEADVVRSGTFRLIHDAGQEIPQSQWPAARAWRGDMVRNMACTIVTGDGRQVPILAQAAPLRDADGTITRVVAVFQDITLLREGEQLKDDFLSMVSHELRTPLTTIHGGAHLLSSTDDEIDADTRRQILDDIVRASDRLDRTLSNVLSLTAIEAGQIDPDIQPLIVPLVVRQQLKDLEARSSDYTFTKHISDALPLAMGNPELLGHVLRNLFENAVKYSPTGSTIDTRIRADARWIDVAVTDQGTGIAPEHVPHVFERFRRPGADPAVRGMGLGLYLSRHLMRVQGGTISAGSPGVGRGSTFTVRLPVATE